MTGQGYIGDTAKRCVLGLLMKGKRGIEARTGSERPHQARHLQGQARGCRGLGEAWCCLGRSLSEPRWQGVETCGRSIINGHFKYAAREIHRCVW